jgi:hypothetical protein
MIRARFFRLACAALAVVFSVGVHAAQTSPSPELPPQQAPVGRASASTSAPVEAVAEVLRLADAASAVFSNDVRRGSAVERDPLADPPALLVGLAAVVVILFVTMRRRRDDN